MAPFPQNASNQKFNNNADGFDLSGGTTARKLSVSAGDVAMAGSGGAAVVTFPTVTSTLAILGANVFTGGQTLPAGSSSLAPLTYSSGPVLTGATAGVKEYDGKVFYCTPIASARGLSPSMMFSVVPSGDFNLSTNSGVQAAFPTTGDVWTLAATTSYFVEGQYRITHSTTACTVAIAFAAGGSLTITSMMLSVQSCVGADNTTATASNMTHMSQLASTVVTISSTANFTITFQGIIRVNVGGTITPQVNWSTATTAPVMKADSYIKFIPFGSNTATLLGNVG